MRMIMVWAALSCLIACGGMERPSPSQPSGPRAATADGTGQYPLPITTPTPTPTPEPGAYAGRTRANASELANMRDLYIDECSICHSALDRSTKRSVTVPRLNAAGVPMAVPLHTDLLQRSKWPRDVGDTQDDGVDTAVLNASALAEILR